MPVLPQIRPATSADAGPVAAVIVDAFLDSPDGPWLIPDRAVRRIVYQRFCAGLIEAILRQDTVLTTADHSAVALWQSSTAGPPELAGYERMLTAAAGPHADRFRQLDAAFAARHPGVAHHYLAYLGVAPARQRTGLGSALLAYRHAELDRAGEAAYLVATSPGSRDLYRRHGYRPHGTPFRLPQGGPPMWPMWRDPVGTGA